MTSILFYTAFIILGGLISLSLAVGALRTRNAELVGWTFDRAQKPFRYWIATSLLALLATYCFLKGSALIFLLFFHYTG